jgi:nucleoid-associated protein YgaU
MRPSLTHDRCPHLHLEHHPGSAAFFPDDQHRCAIRAGSLTHEWQRAYCLAAAHVRCSCFQEAGATPATDRAAAAHVPYGYRRLVAVALVVLTVGLSIGMAVRVVREPSGQFAVNAQQAFQPRLPSATPAGPVETAEPAAATRAVTQRAGAATTSERSATAMAAAGPTPSPTLTASVPELLPTPTPRATASATPTKRSAAVHSMQITITAGETGNILAHTVVEGENLTAIAARYGVTVLEIATANNLDDPNHIYPGQLLRIDVASQAP